MTTKIKLNKSKVIVFLGSMNVMPMAYALELKKQGYEVLYFVDASPRNALCRPEHHYSDIIYPYPPWIIELLLPSQILLSLFPRLFAAVYRWKIGQLTSIDIGCFVLNGFFVALAPFLPVAADKVGLSHGSDLDVWANREKSTFLTSSFRKRSIFKYLPSWMSKILIRYMVSNQYIGYTHTNTICYFPTGFNKDGDNVIHSLTQSGVKYVPRYDISFDLLKEQPTNYKTSGNILRIFSIVRFLFKTFPEGNTGYSKGNDIIIEGIAKFYTFNKDIRIDFVEKGEDVAYAKALCKKYGLEQVVVWHKEMPFKSMLVLLAESDICFDQLGEHWIGAGVYAMSLGKPLIANAESAVRSGVWPPDNPVCSARTSDEVCEWLKKLENTEFRKAISQNSKKFVDIYLSPSIALNQIFDFATAG